jgi:hypothetical protein
MAQTAPAEVSIFRVQGAGTSPTAEKVSTFIEGALRRLYPGATAELHRPEIIHQHIAALAGRPAGSRNVIIVLANRQTVADLARADARTPALYQLGLDPVSPRSLGIPLYLFARVQTVDDIRRNPTVRRRVAVGVSNRTRALLNQEDLSTLLEPILGSQPEIGRTTVDHNVLLNSLLDSTASPERADLVAIYDEEPSLMLQAFLETYRVRQPAGFDALRVQMVLLPISGQPYTPELRRAGQAGATFTVVPDDKVRFSDLAFVLPKDGPDGLVALAPRRIPSSEGADVPVILSNIRTALGDSTAVRREMVKLQQIVSYAYFASLLTDSGATRCSAAPNPAFQQYLLQAFFADSQSLPKSLALWSNVEVTRAGPDPSRQLPENQLIVRMVNDRLKALQTQTAPLDYRKVVDALAPKRTPVSVREQFSSDDAELFRKAAAQVRTVVENPSTNAQPLTEARRGLLELLLKKKGPACELPGLGLFGEKGYDPFFYLSVIDSLLSMQPTTVGTVGKD